MGNPVHVPAPRPPAQSSEDRSSAVGIGVLLTFLALSLGHSVYAVWPSTGVPAMALAELERGAAAAEARVLALADSVRRDSTILTADPTDTAAAAALRRHWAVYERERPSASQARARVDNLQRAAALAAIEPADIRLFGGAVRLGKVDAEARLIVLALLMGAFGSFVYMAQSFATYVGNRTFRASWAWWYLLRPFIGAALALILYFVIRSTLFSTAVSSAAEVNPFGIAAIAGLAGMFSKQATDKLGEVFDTLFRTSPRTGDAQRADKPLGSRPSIDRIDPSPVTATGGQATVTVHGSGFVSNSVVHAGVQPCVTTYVSPKELQAVIATANLGTPPLRVEVTVANPATPTGTPTSAPVTLQIQ